MTAKTTPTTDDAETGDAYDLAVEAAAAELDLLDAAADRVDAGQAVRK